MGGPCKPHRGLFDGREKREEEGFWVLMRGHSYEVSSEKSQALSAERLLIVWENRDVEKSPGGKDTAPGWVAGHLLSSALWVLVGCDNISTQNTSAK